MITAFLHIIYPLLWVVFALWLIRKSRWFRIEGLPVKWIQYGFSLKLLAGIAVWALYTFHYTYRASSDAYGYFDDAMIINSYLLTDPEIWLRFFFGFGMDSPLLTPVFDQMTRWTDVYTYGIANDNPTIIRFNMVIGLFSFGSYHVHTVVFNLLSALGLVHFLRFIQSLTNPFQSKYTTRLTALLILLLPTLLFWGSGVLKESLLLFGLGYFLFHFKKALDGQKKHWLLALLFGFFLFYLKSYVLICLLPGLIAFSICSRSSWHKAVVYPLVLFGSLTIAANAQHFFPAGNLMYILQKKQTDFYNVAEMSDSGSVVEISAVDQSMFGFLLQTPERVLHAIFKPLPWRAKGILYIVPSLEVVFSMVLFCLLLVLAVRTRLTWQNWSISMLNSNYTWLALSFLITFSLIMGSSVPVIGAVVRYKLPVLLLLAGLFHLEHRTEK